MIKSDSMLQCKYIYLGSIHNTDNMLSTPLDSRNVPKLGEIRLLMPHAKC